jgi:hypothetical protein
MYLEKSTWLVAAFFALLGTAACGPSLETQGPSSPKQIAGTGAPGAAEALDAEWFEGATLAEFAAETVGIEALGVYIGDTKIGWAISERNVAKYDGRPAAVDDFEMQFAVVFMGDKKETRLLTKTIYSLEDGTLLYAEEQSIDEQGRVRTTVERDDDEMKIITDNLGRIDRRTVPLPKENLDEERKLAVWLLSDRASGDRFEAFGTAWDQNDVNDPLTYVFRDRKSVWWFGVATEISVLDLLSHGARTRVELAPDGSLVRGSIGPIELRAEDLSTVKNMEVSGIDLLVTIPVDRRLGDPTRVDSLTLEISGLEGFELPTSHRQSVEPRGEDSAVMSIVRGDEVEVEQPLTDEERERFLAATPIHQSDHPDIARLAREVVGDETDPVARADRLQKWVYLNLRKDSGSDSKTALNVLDRRIGDCTEHTLLFVAMARAVGLPAREVGGIVYAELDDPSFGWHAWAEIHDGTRWVTVDPTWNEVYVDATHIKLKQDDDDFSFVNVMGRIEVRVVDFESAP